MSRPWSPGPWQMGHGGFNADRIESAEGSAICQMYGIPLQTKVNEFLAMAKKEPRYKAGLAKLIILAPTLYEVLYRIIADLPTQRDWLDPELEKVAKILLKEAVE